MLVDFFEKLNDDRPVNSADRWKGSADACTDWLLETIKDSPANENALIVGAGRADDFNLPIIVEQFKRIYLLDIDSKSLSIAMDKLTESQKNKVILLPCDITGLADRMNQLIKDMSDKQPVSSVIRSIELFRDSLPKTFKPTLPNSIPKFDWIFSDCISTQFLALVLNQFGTYGTNISKEEQVKIMRLIGNIIDRMLVPYLRLLRSLLTKNGILAFCSDMIEINSKTREKMKNATGLTPELLVQNPIKIAEHINNIDKIHGYNAIYAIYNYHIKFSPCGLLRYWIWNFSDSKQYIVMGIHFRKY